MSRRLQKEDFHKTCYDLANYLLGKLLVRRLENGSLLKGKIVETECYLGVEDKASHSFGGKITPRNCPMFMPEGTAYVYMTYGMYYCFNISSVEPGAAVLLRALEPVVGVDQMHYMRNKKRKNTNKCLKDNELCNGPSKLCIVMDITKDNCNKLDLSKNDMLWLEYDADDIREFKTVTSTRIGINSVEPEWRLKPLRFYIFKNSSVSKRDKNAEKEFLES